MSPCFFLPSPSTHQPISVCAYLAPLVGEEGRGLRVGGLDPRGEEVALVRLKPGGLYYMMGGWVRGRDVLYLFLFGGGGLVKGFGWVRE